MRTIQTSVFNVSMAMSHEYPKIRHELVRSPAGKVHAFSNEPLSH